MSEPCFKQAVAELDDGLNGLDLGQDSSDQESPKLFNYRYPFKWPIDLGQDSSDQESPKLFNYRYPLNGL